MAKREIQKQENIKVEQAWEQAKQIWISDYEIVGEIERLNSCKARVANCNGYVFLISYNTLVAFIDDNGNMFDVLRLVYGYTATSAKHISKFRNKFRHITEHTWREVQ